MNLTHRATMLSTVNGVKPQPRMLLGAQNALNLKGTSKCFTSLKNNKSTFKIWLQDNATSVKGSALKLPIRKS